MQLNISHALWIYDEAQQKPRQLKEVIEEYIDARVDKKIKEALAMRPRHEPHPFFYELPQRHTASPRLLDMTKPPITTGKPMS